MPSSEIVFALCVVFTGAAIFATAALFARQAMIVAYIAVGALCGPGALGLVQDTGWLAGVAEVGYVFARTISANGVPEFNPTDTLMLSAGATF